MNKILTVLFVFLILGFMWNYESTYVIDATVIEIDNKVITVKDERNELWQFITKDEYKPGEQVILTMYDNHTSSNIYDDEIKEVKAQ